MEEGNDEVLLLVDAANNFNMLSRLSMLWTMRHCCRKLSRFAFNCYRRDVRLVCRRPGREALIILSKEGVTQGTPLSMALYGIVLLPLAEILQEEFPSVMQPWYADNDAMNGSTSEVAPVPCLGTTLINSCFEQCRLYLNLLTSVCGRY